MSGFGQKVRAAGAPGLPCWVGGHAYLAMAETWVDIVGPGGEPLRRVPLCDAVPVQAAAAAALAGLAEWRALPAERRRRCFDGLARLLEAYGEHLAGLVVEEGGGLEDAAELQAALAEAAGTSLVPTGGRIAVVITDASAPVLAATALAVTAIAAGWALILKPGSRAPSALLAVAEILTRAGFPDGLLNLVHGEDAVVAALCAVPAAQAFACVGDEHALAGHGAIIERAGRALVSGAPGPALSAAWRRRLGLEV